MPASGRAIVIPDVRAVSLDLDDTLWETGPVIRRAEEELFRWLARHYPRMVRGKTPESLHREAKAFSAAHSEIRHDRSELRRRFLRRLALESAYADDFVESAFRVFWEARNRLVVFDDVIPTLERLAARYPLVAITNGNADIGRAGLGHLFRASISSEAAGVAKPDPEIFRQAVERVGVEASHLVHVGDDPEHDVAGARRAGAWSVWVEPGDREWPLKGARPHAVIRRVGELPALLQLD